MTIRKHILQIITGVLLSLALGASAQITPDTDPGAADSPAATAGADGGNWLETQAEMEALADSGDLSSALALRDRLIELVTLEFGADSVNLAETRRLIADLHRRNREYAAAEEQVLLAIDIYELQLGTVAPELIDPFIDLGNTYYGAGDYTAAVSAYGEARTIGRRNFGLLNEEQLPIVDMMTNAAENLGDLEEARNLQLDALTLIERIYDPAAPETLEAQYKYARWLRGIGRYEEELLLYYQIQRVIREHYDNDPVMRVRSLRERARSYRAADNGDPLGLSGLRDAVALLDAMEDPPVQLLAEVLIDRGDWNVEFNRTRAISDEYLRAWDLAGELENGAELRREWFEDLHVVELPPLSQRGLSTNPDDPRGHVEVFFTVDATGRTRDVQITSSQPPGLKDGAVNRLMRIARFRPNIEGGQFVPTRRGYRFEFRYLPLSGAAAGN